MNIDILKKLGFSDKSVKVYLALLSLGPSSVRSLALEAGLNRGTTYDVLKWLQDKGLVTFYKKDTKQHFVAEPPTKLTNLLREHQEELERTNAELSRFVAELDALHHSGEARPVARYYGPGELHKILEDILVTTEASEEKLYRAYSTEGIREQLYNEFQTFSDVRIARGIHVRAIALGKGGELRGLDERKWLQQKKDQDTPGQDLHNPSPTYIIIYPGKTAYISLDHESSAMGVVIENEGISSMQQLIFDQLWQSL
jgi:HTH-type transcriptional regulator, sugar sensing transcriptional regulator